jgi:hypothetical protein
MKTTFYCVSIEFYDYGKVNVLMTGSQVKQKPNSQYRRVPGMTAYKIWLHNEAVAKELFDGVKSGEIEKDQVSYFFTDVSENEVRAA